MAFRAIGDLAVEVLRNAKAARAIEVAHELNDGAEAGTPSMHPTTGGMENGEDGSPNEGVTSEPSRRNVREESTRATRMGKDGGTTEPAKSLGAKSNPSPARSRPVLSVVSNRCLGTASPAAASGRTPRPVVPRHLVLVSGGHARTVPW